MGNTNKWMGFMAWMKQTLCHHGLWAFSSFVKKINAKMRLTLNATVWHLTFSYHSCMHWPPMLWRSMQRIYSTPTPQSYAFNHWLTALDHLPNHHIATICTSLRPHFPPHHHGTLGRQSASKSMAPCKMSQEKRSCNPSDPSLYNPLKYQTQFEHDSK